MKALSAILVVTCVVSCNPKPAEKQVKDDHADLRPEKVSEMVHLVGTAAELGDYLDKVNQPGIITEDGRQFIFRGNFTRFHRDMNGKKISVTGKLIKERKPMSIYDPAWGPDYEPPQMIPVPPGTDIEKASLVYAIEDPDWHVTQ